MKKITLQIIIYLMLIAGGVTAQNLIAVQNGGNPEFYTKLDSAIVHAQNGDTIYLPGGNFTINDSIDKCIHFIGAGHDPDSTNFTERTIISGSRQLILKNGADNGSVSGIYFNSSGYYGEFNIQFIGNITNYTISRCYIFTGIYIASQSNNVTMIENIIVYLNSAGSNIYCLNNILLGFASFSYSNIIRNNIFTFTQGGYQQYTGYGNDCLFENNIFNPGSIFPWNYGNGNIYHNNLNAGVNGISGTHQGSGNFLDDVDLSTIFTNYNSSTYGDAVYYNDFTLPLESPYKNAGTDGTDIGIYGGSFPWKDGSIPFNPHVQYKSIGGTTDNEGNLNVNIKVSAQDR